MTQCVLDCSGAASLLAEGSAFLYWTMNLHWILENLKLSNSTMSLIFMSGSSLPSHCIYHLLNNL